MRKVKLRGIGFQKVTHLLGRSPRILSKLIAARKSTLKVPRPEPKSSETIYIARALTFYEATSKACVWPNEMVALLFWK